jgi:hypothetical protein
MFMESFMAKAARIDRILARAPKLDKTLCVEKPEFLARQKAAMETLDRAGADCGFAYSDERCCGDVPYLSGCTNLSIEPVAACWAPRISHPHRPRRRKRGRTAEPSLRLVRHRVKMPGRTRAECPAEAEQAGDVLFQALGRIPKTIGLLTRREALPVSVYRALCDLVGEEHVIDCQEDFPGSV